MLADHIRSVAFLIADGVIPSNEGRGYVLRRIIRRAVRHGNKLGATDAFFYQLVHPLADIMGDAYPQLRHEQHKIEQAILKKKNNLPKHYRRAKTAVARIGQLTARRCLSG